MRLVIALFLLALLTTAATSVAIAVWDGRNHHHDALRAIHYGAAPERLTLGHP